MTLSPIRPLAVAGLLALLAGCSSQQALPIRQGMGPHPALPEPQTSLLPTINIAPAVGWPDGARPLAGKGLAVNAFASGLDHPRWLYVLPNGDVLAAETNAPATDSRGLRDWAARRAMDKAGAATPSADRIRLLRDSDGDGVADRSTVFLDGLHSPFGMALIGDQLYIANTDAVLRFPYQSGQTHISAPGELLTPLPAGPRNRHWTRNLITDPDGHALYVAIGANSNVAENGMDAEQGRAAIWRIEVSSGTARVYASGLRNGLGATQRHSVGRGQRTR